MHAAMTDSGPAPDSVRLRLLYDLGCAFASQVQLDELSAVVVAKCREALDAEGAAILLHDEARGELYFPYVADEDPQVARRLLALRFPAGRGIAGTVLQSGRPLRIDDVSSDARFYSGVDRHTGLTTRSILCAPLRARHGTIGVIQVLNRRNGIFGDDDLAFLDALAGSVAVAIENARLYAQLRASAEQLAEANRTLELKVAARTQELRERNDDLERTLTQLKNTQQQLIVQEKLASLGALTAGVAHEIRNPLNFITNFAQLAGELTNELRAELDQHRDRFDPKALDNLDDTLSDLTQNVRKINEHGQRADRIVQGMLQHARPRTAERQNTDLNALLAEYVNLAYHGLRGQDATFNVTLESDYDPSVGAVPVVPQDIARAFLNLLSNAFYAVQDKKRRFGEGDGFSPTVRVQTNNLGDRVEVRIRDNGNGVPPADREKVFTPFFTTKPPGAGTGLGLSLTHDIVVQQHHGELRLDSEDGAYAEFTIVLPRSTTETGR
ncbi:MAG TPA: ATP-binding protein [Candidatus Binatia bacterium]|nr:ATP-binding protein [Candidatus Binatia bacterium]